MTPPGPRGRTLSLVTQAPDVSFYVQRDYGRGPVLVLGAADGRVAFEIASRGVPVLAVDPSEVMIRAAEARKAGERAETSSRIRLLHSDLRALRLDESFEAVVAPQNALGLLSSLDDLDALFATAKVHLRPAGTLVLDLVNPAAAPVAPRPRGEGRRPDGGAPGPALPSAVPTFVPHLHERTRADSSEAIHRLKIRPFTVDEVDEALTAAGFVALQRFGGFDGKPFDPEDPVQIVVAALEPYGLKH